MRLFDQQPSAADFATLAKCLILGKGFAANSLFFAKEYNASERVKSVITKAGVAAGSAGDSSWGGALLEFQIIQAGFLESIRNISLFDSLLQYMKRVPPRTQATVVTSGATSTTVAEGAWLPLTRLSFAGIDLDPIKSQALIVVTEELLKYTTPGAQTLWADELRSAVALQTDKTVLPILLSGLSLAASTGDPDEDLLQAFSAINLGQLSRPVIAMSPVLIKELCFLSSGSGRRFPDLSLYGGGNGSIAGVPVIPCDALTGYSSDGNVTLVCDAAQLAGDSISIGLNTSTETSVLMTDSAGSGAENMTSMFQTNSAAILAERWITLVRLKSTCVAAIKNCSYDNGSP